jgi:hypothetical protein
VNHASWAAGGVQHTALNKSKTDTQNTTHLGPLRAAQKIFDSWCRHQKLVINTPTPFVIQETTRGKQGKLYSYTGFREKLDQPRLVSVTNKKTNETNTVAYAHRSKVKALRKVTDAPSSSSVATPASVKKGAAASNKKSLSAAKATGKSSAKTPVKATSKSVTKAAAKTKSATKATGKTATKAATTKTKMAKNIKPAAATSKANKASGKKAVGSKASKTTVSLS